MQYLKPSLLQDHRRYCEMPVAKGLWPHAYSQPIPGNFSVLAGLREARGLSDTLIVFIS